MMGRVSFECIRTRFLKYCCYLQPDFHSTNLDVNNSFFWSLFLLQVSSTRVLTLRSVTCFQEKTLINKMPLWLWKETSSRLPGKLNRTYICNVEFTLEDFHADFHWISHDSRGWQRDFRKDVKNGDNVPCWFIHNNGTGLLDGVHTDYIVSGLFKTI